MSTNFIINQNTNIKSEQCVYTYQDKTNETMFNYSFLPSVAPNNNTRNSYIDSTKTLGILQNTNYDINGENI